MYFLGYRSENLVDLVFCSKVYYSDLVSEMLALFYIFFSGAQ